MAVVLNDQEHMLCEDDYGNILVSHDPEYPGLLIYNKLEKSVFVVPDSEDIRQSLSTVCLKTMQDDDINESNFMQESNSDIDHLFPKEIWSGHSSKKIEQEANNALTKLVEGDVYKPLINKLKWSKKIWDEIGAQMIALGYSFGTRDPAIVCAQKWKNLKQQNVKIRPIKPNVKLQKPKHNTIEKTDDYPVIWMKNHDLPVDGEASETLVKIVTGHDFYSQQLRRKFDENNEVWQQIAKEMIKEGFDFGDSDPGIACYKKWKMMEEKVEKYLKYSSNPYLKAKITKPSFFDKVYRFMNAKTFEDEHRNEFKITNEETNYITNEQMDNNDSEILLFLKKDAELRKKQHMELMELIRLKMKEDKQANRQVTELLTKLLKK